MPFPNMYASFPLEYVDAVGELVFSMPQAERSAILSKYKTKTPAPLNSQFTDKHSRAEAVEITIRENKKKQLYTPQVQLMVISPLASEDINMFSLCPRHTMIIHSGFLSEKGLELT